MKYIKGKQYGHKMFYEILKELAELHSRKNFQYTTIDNPLGNFIRCGDMMSPFYKEGINPNLAVLINYMSKQWDGVVQMVGHDKSQTCDQLEDKFLDLACYSIIAMILIRERKK